MFRFVCGVFLFSFLLSGCCLLAKRSCFADCDPPKIVTVSKCKLPGTITLPAAPRSKSDACPVPLICYDKTSASNLLIREGRMKAWIKETRSRCGTPSSDAASTVPDATPGSPLDAGVDN